MIDPMIAGQVAFVTGANNPEGIGAATVRALATQGARVFVTGLMLEEAGNELELPKPGDERYRRLRARPTDALVSELKDLGLEVEGRDWDLADSGAIPALLDEVEDRLGPVTILVNNAAHSGEDTFAPTDAAPAASLISADQHDRHFAVNSRGPALLMAEFARRHIRRGATRGRVINISTDGASGHAGAVSYGASKHALESYSRAAAWELGPYGITVNVVAPGPVQTGWITAKLEEALLPGIPLRRIGAPEDIADAVVFLASDQARWITGQVLYVGGGQVMGL
jgi:3-oxoacyl-[acyl-carrier protein] reductase